MRFSEKALLLVCRIPRGNVSTYKAIAIACGSPKAARAVGNALNKNSHPVKVPCHRVVKCDGRIGGYALGVKRKIALLESEGLRVKQGKIENFRKFLFNLL